MVKRKVKIGLAPSYFRMRTLITEQAEPTRKRRLWRGLESSATLPPLPYHSTDFKKSFKGGENHNFHYFDFYLILILLPSLCMTRIRAYVLCTVK